MKRGIVFVALVVVFVLAMTGVAFAHHMSPNPGPGLIENWDEIDLVAHGVSAEMDGNTNMVADVSMGPHGGI